MDLESLGFDFYPVETRFDEEDRHLRTLGVLDDREEREQALDEMKVISRITQTKLYTDLVTNAEKHKDRLFA